MYYTKERVFRLNLRATRKRKKQTLNCENTYFIMTMVISSIVLIVDFYIVNQFLIILSNIK